MPHIIVEYSKGLRSEFHLHSMLEDLHESISGLHGVTKDRIKTRAHKTDDYLVGDHGKWAEMIHINLKLAPGRTDEQKTELAQILHKVASKYIAEDSYANRSLTVEVSELHGPSYQP